MAGKKGVTQAASVSPSGATKLTSVILLDPPQESLRPREFFSLLKKLSASPITLDEGINPGPTYAIIYKIP